jgi:allantoate deiminase
MASARETPRSPLAANPSGIAALARKPGSVQAYLEVHIEQGPVLEAQNEPVGIVTAINAQSRARIRVTGEAGHAGTVPMSLRRDALTAAPRWRWRWRRSPPRMNRRSARSACSGPIPARPMSCPVRSISRSISAHPNETLASHGCRHPQPLRRDRGAARRRAGDHALFANAEPCRWNRRLQEASRRHRPHRQQSRARRLPSGAGHDAMAMATVCPARDAVRPQREGHQPFAAGEHDRGRCRHRDPRPASKRFWSWRGVRRPEAACFRLRSAAGRN